MKILGTLWGSWRMCVCVCVCVYSWAVSQEVSALTEAMSDLKEDVRTLQHHLTVAKDQV